ncbi:MAG: tRNA uridine-5-carboxymethylaminomethyl(34) synthesis GTPase MnmE [Gammaproteobacteria bacterium RIFCSPHIGHO2_12_FULL_42_10]|nr:MAG: tRNA uridine-5-carboxymethylaminomethyl(34) synthesis GTPase MnmE [Gammaproteobacteria bacterium RIFCSPHIGHO2_12_FULL_42_10]
MLRPNNIDTIVAQATPFGRGGVAVVRLSGPIIRSIMRALFGCELTPRQATYLPFKNSNGCLIDQGLAIFFEAPHSFTGEDILELQCHGSPVVVDLLLQHTLSLGARIARPGEFSERAFLNSKIDLTQAEAIADLIAATGTRAARLALQSLQGEFSKAIHAINKKIIALRTYIEAMIDFSEEDIELISDTAITEQLQRIITGLMQLTTGAKQGSLLREGITVVIMGEPNVGKSSLLNCLSEKEIAIVTETPGTTRDVLRDTILIAGIPTHIIDTAGIRESDDLVEQEGMRRAYQEIEKADLVIRVTDATTDIQNTTINNTCTLTILLEKAGIHPAPTHQNNCPIITIRNKIDLLSELPSLTQHENHICVALSAKTGVGVDLLKNAIQSHVGLHAQEEGLFLARRRHLDALSKTTTHITDALNQLQTTRSIVFIAEDLRLAQQSLNEITGEFTSDDLLGSIFSTFCIGK